MGIEKEPVPGPAVFGMRPEHVAFNSGAGWPFTADANVEVVEPMGSDSLLWGRVGNESVSIRVGPDDEHKIGEKVDVYFQPRLASVFDAQTGARL